MEYALLLFIFSFRLLSHCLSYCVTGCIIWTSACIKLLEVTEPKWFGILLQNKQTNKQKPNKLISKQTNKKFEMKTQLFKFANLSEAKLCS